MKKFIRVIKPYIVCLLIGIIIGTIVGLYELGMKYIQLISTNLYSNQNVINIIIIVICTLIFSIANYFIIKLCPQIDGSGVPMLELGIRNLKPINYKFDVIGMIINSYISSFVGFPLGSEGPSVVISGKLSKLVCDLTKTDSNDIVPIASGIGFGCAFLSPISGFIYIFEEMLHQFNFKILLHAIFIILGAFCTTFFINKHHLLNLNTLLIPSFDTFYVLIFITIANVLIGFLFVKFIIILKDYFNKHKASIFVKYRGFLYFIIIMILNFFLLKYMGSGGTIMGSNVISNSLIIVSSIFLLRFILTIISGTGSVTGGLVVPTMTIGYLIGQIIGVIFNKTLNLSTDYIQIYSLISACMLFAIVTKTPLTASSLLISTILRLSNYNIVTTFKITLLPIVFIFISLYLYKFFKLENLYDEQIKLILKNYK